VYYRYVYFLEDGRCLYALTPSAPHEIFRRLVKICCSSPVGKHQTAPLPPPATTAGSSTAEDCVVWGRYEIHKNKVIVDARQPWQYVRLELSIQPHVTMHGRFGYLSFDRHMTSTRPMRRYSANHNPASDENTINYEVPDKPFRFIPCKDL
jgi:hypothetical protein